MWEESITMIPKIWQSGVFSHDGRYVKVGPCSVVPKPLQKPHPPMWVAGNQPATYEIAGRMGLGMLCFGPRDLGELEQNLGLYRKALRDAQPVGAFVNAKSAVSIMTHCGTDDQEAKRIGAMGAEWFFSRARQILNWQGVKAESYRYYQEQRARLAASPAAGGRMASLTQSDVLCAGNPESCIQYVRRVESLGIDEFICYMQLGGIPHPAVMSSIRTFGQHVIPRCK
jgi:alkanesulfonate monooxygenase SsuD/methylene tetrahydromethanopterin reductase-like flavin-dependent oxidoreductase (luciferase family)